jgi:hypothetical protein
MIHAACLGCVLLLPWSLATTTQEAGETVAFPEYGLTLVLPKLDSIARQKPEGSKAEWTGQLGASQVRLRFHVLANADYDFFEPEDVVETWRDAMRDPDDKKSEAKDTDFSFEPTHCVAGAVGCSPILACTQAAMQKKNDPTAKGTLMIVAGLLPENAWSMRADVWPALDAERTKALASSLEKCCTYQGKLRDPQWTDDEATAFWKKMAPESTFKKLAKPVRTEHFIVLTNSTSPGPFVKKLEGWYASIRKVVPWEELKGRKLMPILLYRTDDDFQTFYRKYWQMKPEEEVDDQSETVDYWTATSCDDDDDYDHLLDMCKQVLIVRLRAWGGCQWMRSGVRELVATKPNERGEALRAIKKGEFTPLEKLLDNDAWGEQGDKYEKKGASDEADYWGQAALWMEFLRTGPWPNDSFQRFVRTAGSLPDGDREGVKDVLRTVYGMEPSALQQKWVEHFSKH